MDICVQNLLKVMCAEWTTQYVEGLFCIDKLDQVSFKAHDLFGMPMPTKALQHLNEHCHHDVLAWALPASAATADRVESKEVLDKSSATLVKYSCVWSKHIFIEICNPDWNGDLRALWKVVSLATDLRREVLCSNTVRHRDGSIDSKAFSDVLHEFLAVVEVEGVQKRFLVYAPSQ